MKRRDCLVAISTTVAVSSVGCLDFLEDDTESPKSVSKAFLAALLNGDEDEATDLLHPESKRTVDVSPPADGQIVSSSAFSAEVAIENFTAADMNSSQYHSVAYEETISELRQREDLTLVQVNIETESGDDAVVFVLTATDGGDWLVLDYDSHIY